jgi:EmrB/QacA subfamily drug resistance transporter
MTAEVMAPAETGMPRDVRMALTALVVGGVAAVLDTTIVAIALQSLVTDLHSSVGQIQWVSTGYLLALAVVIPVTGWAQRRFGGKRLWLAALSVFLLGSVLSAAAWNAESLIAFRVFQGLGAGIVFPLMMTLAMQAAAALGGSRSRTMATVSLPVALGPILGPVLGGVILNWLDWRWLFLVNVPIVAVALWMAVKYLPADRPSAAPVPGARSGLDVLGLVLIAPALVGLLLGLSNVHKSGGFGRPDAWGPIVAGAVLLIAFVVRALRVDAALVDVRLLGKRGVASSSMLLFLTGFCIYGAMFLLPLYWQNLRGFSVLDAALLLIPQGVGSLLSRTVAGRLTETVGTRAVAVVGFALIAITTVPFALADAGTSRWWLEIVLLLRGLGLGAVLIPVMSVAYLGLEGPQVADASMITRVAQQVGGSFGTAIAAVVLQSALASGSAEGFRQAFWWTIGFTVLAALLSFALPAEAETRN